MNCPHCGFRHPPDGICLEPLKTPKFKSPDLKDWEQSLIEQAEYYTVIRKHGRMAVERKEFKDFLEAMKDAVCGAPLPTAMVYAVAPDGRSTLVTRDRWVTLLRAYEARATSEQRR